MNTEQPPEALAAVIADYRADIPAMTSGELPHPTPEYLRILLDRIDAAAKRERAITDIMLAVKDKPLPHPDPDNAPPLFAAPGNAAAMREALEAMLDECCNLCDVPNQMTESGHTCNWRNRWVGCQSKAIDKADAALAAPARNCDVSRDTKETIERCLASLDVESSSASFDAGVCAAIGWMLAAPAKGGRE